VRIHRRHRGRAERLAITRARTELFEDEFALGPRITARALLMAHDDLGVAALRFSVRRDTHEHPATLGFATDLGRVTDELIDHLHGVGVLAIESNYCPRMQADSTRSAALKHRIMGGSGHLSNQECLAATDRIEPAHHTVLLHLSRECNHPSLPAALHRGRPVTISSQHEPTPWVFLRPVPPVPAPLPVVRPLGLFAATARGL
jgi:phosphoribosyl 1,2-cyclic phosphodiesterase